MCPTGKKVYERRGDAWEAGRVIIKRKNVGVATPYECKFCGKWHLTSRPKRQDMSMAKWRDRKRH